MYFINVVCINLCRFYGGTLPCSHPARPAPPHPFSGYAKQRVSAWNNDAASIIHEKNNVFTLSAGIHFTEPPVKLFSAGKSFCINSARVYIYIFFLFFFLLMFPPPLHHHHRMVLLFTRSQFAVVDFFFFYSVYYFIIRSTVANRIRFYFIFTYIYIYFFFSAVIRVRARYNNTLL